MAPTTPGAWRTPHVRRAAIEAELVIQREHLHNRAFHITNFIAAGDVVAVEFVETLTAASQDLEMHTVNIFEVNHDSKVTTWRTYTDMEEFRSQLPGA